MKKLLFLLCFALWGNFVYSQFKVSAELRPRFEYDHGYKSLYANDPNGGVSQRTRLNLDFAKDKLIFRVSMQDIRTWGDVPTLNQSDDHFSVHEAWGEILFSDVVSLKIGRQELKYDDQRIFGSVNWAQQGRSHDLGLLKIKAGDNGKLHLGVAFNDDNVNVAPYKYLQYMWYHRDYDKFNFSILFLNNGVENATTEETHYGQTIGTHINVNPVRKIKFSGSLYYQFGEDVNKKDVSAMEFKLDAKYLLSDQFTGMLGYEYLSGSDNNDTKNKSFNPLFGTNHKFNGWMDYFYVGNHINNVGLNDFNIGIGYKKNQFSAVLKGHHFRSDADLTTLTGKKENSLGTELDLMVGFKYDKDISFKAGFSHMFASDGMDILKGTKDDGNNMWGWLMISINPTLFTTKL